MSYDLLITGGQVMDPGAGLMGELEVGIAGGRIAAVAAHLDSGDAKRTVDVDGALVVPGMIDLHVHSYWGCTHWGLELDPIALRTGVTTGVDAGSAGGHNWRGFRRYVAEQSQARSLAFLNISSIGLTAKVNELMDLYYADQELAVDVAGENRDLIVGLKVRLNPDISGNHGLEALKRTVEAAQRLEMPIMVHIARTPPTLEEILAQLRPGDIITHCFTGRNNRLLTDSMQVREEVLEARRRGVLLDVGHGLGSFGYQIAEPLLAQGLLPDTISSDLHAHNVDGPVYDLPTTLGKFLNMGMEIPDLMERVTSRAAAALGRAGELGTLKPGTPADIAVLRVEHGRFNFADSYGERRIGNRRLVNILTVIGGQVAFQAD